jgi:hypothetical protein
MAIRCSGLLALGGTLSAQLPSAPMMESFISPEARMEMLEKTYATNLRPIHGPVMQDYLRELDLLKSKMTAGGRAADAIAVDAEIARVRLAVATTGVFPFNGAAPVAAADPVKVAAGPGTKPAPDAPPRAALTLQASKATGSTVAAGGAAPLGTLEWTVDKLPAGTYDVAMVFACAPLDGPDQITLSIPGVTQNFTLPVERSTGSEKDFRIFRLGTITLDKDVAAGSARLQSASPTPKLLVRSVIFSRPKPPPPPPAGT